MSADRSELYELIGKLPESEVASAADDLRRRIAGPRTVGTWPPEFFGIIDGDDMPEDLAGNVDDYLAGLGFGRDSL
jgi:hypothetical protein